MYQSRKALYQWVLLSWAEVKSRLVEHLHKVLQAGHIHFILHRLQTHKHKHLSPHTELQYTRSEPNSTQITQVLFTLPMQHEIHFNCVSVATTTSSTSNHLTKHVPSWTLEKSHQASVKWYVYKMHCFKGPNSIWNGVRDWCEAKLEYGAEFSDFARDEVQV